MLGIILETPKQQSILEQTKLLDIVETIKTLKWSWEGNLDCLENNYWTINKCTSREKKRYKNLLGI